MDIRVAVQGSLLRLSYFSFAGSDKFSLCPNFV